MEEEQKGYSGIEEAIIAIFAFYFLYKFLFPDKWMGFYYPDENNLFKYTRSQELKSLEECKEWIDTQRVKFNPSGYRYEYECGKNCKPSDLGVNIYQCDETKE